MTDDEAIMATNALKDWFKSQGLLPHEAVLCAERFIANMILANQDYGGAIEAKIDTTTDRIRRHIALKLLSNT